MPLNKSGLKTEIKDNLISELGSPTDPDGEEKLEKMAKAIADAVIDHFIANAVTTLNNGVDSNGDTLSDLTGTIG